MKQYTEKDRYDRLQLMEGDTMWYYFDTHAPECQCVLWSETKNDSKTIKSCLVAYKDCPNCFGYGWMPISPFELNLTVTGE